MGVGQEAGPAHCGFGTRLKRAVGMRILSHLKAAALLCAISDEHFIC